jgi:hypothetical protein
MVILIHIIIVGHYFALNSYSLSIFLDYISDFVLLFAYIVLSTFDLFFRQGSFFCSSELFFFLFLTLFRKFSHSNTKCLVHKSILNSSCVLLQSFLFNYVLRFRSFCFFTSSVLFHFCAPAINLCTILYSRSNLLQLFLSHY